MTLKLELELSDADLEHFRKVMDATWQRNAQRDERDILESARRLLGESRGAEAPAYVKKRLEDIDTLISMLEDREWPLEQKHRRRILAAVSYFADPKDMIPDQLPGIGFLDDALMAELVVGELEPELDGYREFCEYRENEESRNKHATREEWLAAKRRQVFLQIQRRQRESRRHWSTEGPTDPILRYESYDY
jgi:uncharacterized membrane protein YkvA (DUF1232 family)